jgi:hypothetical protein
MIRYLKHNDIDKAKWDSCIRTAVNAVTCAESWYLNLVCDDWDALVEDDYLSVFPLTAGKKMGIHYLFQPAFTQQLGIFSRKALTKELVNEFLDHIPRKFRFVDISLNQSNKTDHPGFKITRWQNFELNLNPGYDRLFQNYSENLRRNLKKAEKSGLVHDKETEAQKIITLFRNNRGRDIKSLASKDYSTLSRLIVEGKSLGNIYTIGVINTDKSLYAGAVLLKGNDRIVFLFSGLSDEGRKSGAMSLLIDSIIREHSSQNIIFDFEGSNDTNLARYYKSFGSLGNTYPHLEMNRLPGLVSVAVMLSKWLRRLLLRRII